MLYLNQMGELYTYEKMTKDLELLGKRYPESVRLESLGDTPDGRRLWHLMIGGSDGKRHVFINAAIHGREYVTTWLVMRQAAAFLEKNADSGEEMEKDVVVHLVPMVNPDGVSISQLGLGGCRNEKTKELVEEILKREHPEDREYFLKRWKANGQGIDLNRNFDAMWEEYEDGVGVPSSDHYKGTAPGCAPEARALIGLTEKYAFDRTVSYHAQGSVIYWNFGQSGRLKEETLSLARKIGAATGYSLDGDFSLLDPAGYKDWALSRKSIPSLTIEVGREFAPVDPSQYERIWQENQDVWRLLIKF